MSRSSRSRRLRASERFGRAIEALEGRWMLSGTADLDPVTHVLTVDGDNTANNITLNETGGVIHVTVDGAETDPAGYSGVQSVLVHGFDGNDTVDLGNITRNAYVRGGAGNDVITSGPGDDTLSGEGGDDRYIFKDNWGRDVVDEAAGAGNDTMDFSACTGNLLVNIGALTVLEGNNVAVHGGSDIENVIGGSGNDTFHFLNSSTSIAGTLDGGTGSNSIDYSAFDQSHPVSVDLVRGEGTATGGIANISNIVGGAGNDTITGTVGGNTIDGGPGNDLINGGGGSDSITFGATSGHDTVTEPAGAAVSYDFSSYNTPLLFFIAPGSVTVSTGGQVLATGGSEVNRLVGGSAADQVIFARGATFNGQINGGGGANILDYRAFNTAVQVSLRDGLATATQGISGFSTVYGGSANDLLIGDNNANALYGSAGKDKIYGLAGDDSLDGGDGDDFIYGGDGNDSIRGGNGNDRLYGEAGNDKIWGGAGNDMLNGGAGSDYLNGEAGNDALYSRDRKRDTLLGGAGSDKGRVDARKLDRVAQIETYLR